VRTTAGHAAGQQQRVPFGCGNKVANGRDVYATRPSNGRAVHYLSGRQRLMFSPWGRWKFTAAGGQPRRGGLIILRPVHARFTGIVLVVVLYSDQMKSLCQAQVGTVAGLTLVLPRVQYAVAINVYPHSVRRIGDEAIRSRIEVKVALPTCREVGRIQGRRHPVWPARELIWLSCRTNTGFPLKLVLL
jgi:hypothetical protein